MVERPNSVTLFHFFICIDFISSLIMAIQSDLYSNISEWASLKPLFYKLLQPRLRQNDFTMSHGVTMIHVTKLLALGSRHPLFFWILKFLKFNEVSFKSMFSLRLPTSNVRQPYFDHFKSN